MTLRCEQGENSDEAQLFDDEVTRSNLNKKSRTCT